MPDDPLRKRLRPLKITFPTIRWLRHLVPLFLIGLGVPGNVIVVVILGYRLFAFWIPTFLGFPTAVYLQQVTGQKGMDATTS